MSDVELVTSADAVGLELVARALDSLTRIRGGSAIRRDLESICGADTSEGILAALSRSRSALYARRHDTVVGVLAVTHVTPCAIMGVFVDEPFRRQGIGGSLVRAARTEFGAHDGWASPGDRATKSLYESAGWKARLLTMSDEES